MRVDHADKRLSSYFSCISLLLIFLAAISVIAAMTAGWRGPTAVAFLIFIVPGVAIGLYEAALAFLVLCYLPHMRYELRDNALYLILGPWKSRIPYDHIIDVVRKDMAFSALSSFRMPGIAVFGVNYSDEGTVRMYSTHELKDVTLIKTIDGKKYGISPADPDGFMAALKQACDVGTVHEEKTSTTGNVTTVPVSVRGHLGWAAWVSLSLAMATLIISLVMFARLPATLTIHWDLLGVPNGFLPRFWGAFLIPFLSLLSAIAPLVIPEGTGTARKTWYALVVSVLGILFLCQLFLLLWNTGIGTANGKVFVPLLIILIAGSIAIQLVYIGRVNKQSKHPLSTYD